MVDGNAAELCASSEARSTSTGDEGSSCCAAPACGPVVSFALCDAQPIPIRRDTMNALIRSDRCTRRTLRMSVAMALTFVSLTCVTQSSSPAEARALTLERHEYRQIAM